AAGGSIQPARAAANGPAPRLFAAGNGPADERGKREGRRPCERDHGARDGGRRGAQGRARHRRAAAAGRRNRTAADARAARRNRRAHRRGSGAVQGADAIGRGARGIRSIPDEEEMTGPLKGKTLFITGASRGIGLAIALRAAADGANIAIAAKTVDPHPKLEGTIHSAAAAIEKAGGRALPLAVDVREDASVREALDKTAATFGGLDVVVNNASAI